jgi:hypothetical protein
MQLVVAMPITLALEVNPVKKKPALQAKAQVLSDVSRVG